MKNRIYLWLAATMVLLLGISLSVPAKSDDVKRPGFTEADQAYYLDEELYTFIRPGLVFTLIDFEIPGDNQPLVTFSIKDPGGLPLDPTGVYTPGPVDLRFMLAYIPTGEENKVNYNGPGGRDRNGTLTDMGDGTWTYKFGTALPADYDADATHTLASVATRDLREFADMGLGRYYDNDVYNFVPSGAGEPMPRDIVATDSCNRCHNPLGEHGGRYQEVQVCTQCHNPQLFDNELSLTYDYGPMVHRVHSSNEPQLDPIHYPAVLNDCQICHRGGTPTADMPLVANPNPIPTCDGSGFGMTALSWGDEGAVDVRLNSASGSLFAQANGAGSQETGNWVRDGQKFVLTDSASGEVIDETTANLTVYGCAGNAPFNYAGYGATGALHTNWMTRPSRTDCGGCHAYIDWETGEGHPAGPQEDDEFCSFCHAADSGNEFDRSVKGAHTVPLASDQLKGLIVKVKEVTGTGPGQRPTVLFSLNDKTGPVDPATLETFTLTLNGPNDDFAVNVRENARSGLTAVGSDWSYTFNARVPSDAEGSYSVGFEGRRTVTLQGRDGTVRDSAENALFAVAVTDDEPVARRQVVDDAKCESCHSNLSLHGDNRKNATAYCQTCHMPSATDEAVRLEGEDESIHFKYMIHKIHRGAELENLPYIVYGYRSSVHDYSEVHYPGDLRDCDACHVDTDPSPRVFRSSSWLPLPEGAAPTYAPSAYITEMGPETATCLSCHDGFAAAAHADANTGGLGESCSACHGEGKTYSVQRVHSR